MTRYLGSKEKGCLTSVAWPKFLLGRITRIKVAGVGPPQGAHPIGPIFIAHLTACYKGYQPKLWGFGGYLLPTTSVFVGTCIFHIAMAATRNELDLLALVTPPACDLEFSTTSSSIDEIRGSASSWPEPWSGYACSCNAPHACYGA